MQHLKNILLLIFIIMTLTGCDKPQTQKKDKIVEAIPIVTVAPAYPKQAALDKIEGEVSIGFTIAIDGTVKNPKIYASSPKKTFDRAALRAVLKYKFAPKTVNKKPVESEATQTFTFKLDEE